MFSIAVAILFAVAQAEGHGSCSRPAAIEARLRQHPSASAYAEAGTWFNARGDFKCAAQDYTSAARLDPKSPRIALLLGKNFLQAGSVERAEAPLRQAISLDPEKTEPHLILAAVLEQLQRKDDAESEWSAALKLDPKSVPAIEGMAKHLVAEGSYAQAIQLLRSEPGDEALVLDLAQVYAAAGSLADAETLLRKSVADRPSSFVLLRALIGVLVDEHTHERAFAEPIQMAEKFAAAHPDNIAAQRLLLQLSIAWIPEGGQTADASRVTPLAKRLLASHPNEAYFLYANGLLEQQAGDYANAKAHLEKSLAADPQSDQAHYALGMVLAAQNDAHGATEQFEKALALGDTRPEVRFQLAKALRATGNTEQADKQFKMYSDAMAEVSNQTIVKLKDGQAATEMAQGHFAQAAVLYREAISVSPRDASLRFKLANALDKAGDPTGEKAALESALEIDPAMAVAHNQLGYLASRSGDSAAAEEHFRLAVRAAPSYAEAWINLAATLGMESKVSEAQQAVARALKADPNNSQALQLQQELGTGRH